MKTERTDSMVSIIRLIFCILCRVQYECEKDRKNDAKIFFIAQDVLEVQNQQEETHNLSSTSGEGS